MWFDTFLAEREPRRWRAGEGFPAAITAGQVFLQDADYGLELAVGSASHRPTTSDMRRAWAARQGGRPSPVLLAVGYPDGAATAIAVCGPAGENPPVYFDLDVSRIERLAATALAEPHRHAAQRCLLRLLPELESDLPGMVNSGLLASHELRYGVPLRADWAAATAASRPALRKRGRDLVKALGFTVTHLGTNTSLLSAGHDRRAVAVFLDEGEAFEAPGVRFEGVSPVSHALALAGREQLPWVVLTRGPEIRLYAVKPDVGVGRRGPSQTFIEANLALLPEDRAGFLQLLFSAQALSAGGSFDEILDSSADFASDLATRLRERVYREAVPSLAEGIAATLGEAPDQQQLADAYDQTLNVLFRLLFVAYGEDKDLLPYRTNSRYADHSLKRMARRLAEDANRGALTFAGDSHDLWEDVVQLWDAVRVGNAGWGVPAYNGGLFSVDPVTNPAGAALQEIRLSNAQFGPALTALLIDTPDDGDDALGPVDFRSLSVREFGTLYEGLLESELSVAPMDLAVDGDGNYIPAAAQDAIVVTVGSVYLHNSSGERKATGSYFTKPFAVEHLLDQALEPSLAAHVARLQRLVDAGDEAAAAKAFFDYRCADIAMGSGHFLVAAVDRIEARLSAFLALNPIPTVTADLDTLRNTAMQALGELADGVEIEMTALLRRQVGRRCIYGVDRNVIAVELARLAIWIHTFVPGLPLSFLDHNLVTGNSLIGIASIDEAISILAGDDDAPTLYRDEIVAFLERGAAALTRLATIDDATVADVRAAQQAHLEALDAVEPAEALFDVLIAARFDGAPPPVSVDEESIRGSAATAGARETAEQVSAVHFPVAFPEVFLRERAGFDCVLGNPPWDKVLFEPQQFWVTRVPGLNALPQARRAERIEQLRVERPADAIVEQREKAERERFQGYVERAYPLRGRGHYDFAKLFTERALALLNGEAALGYVLPASSMLLGGWSRIRAALLADSATTVAQARNKACWLFEIEPRTSVVFIGRHRTGDPATVTVWPGLTTPAELRNAGSTPGLRLGSAELTELSDTMVVPWLNSAADRPVFEAMQSRPSVSSGKGWITGTHDARWDFRSSGPHRRFTAARPSEGAWRVLMTRHVVPYSIDDTIAFQLFIPDPGSLPNGVTNIGGVAGFDESHPLVIVRHPTRNDDSRTMIATALPQDGFVHSKGYVHAIKHSAAASTDDLLALLGFLNTFTCDWWIRRFVDRHVTAPVVNNVRLPDWSAAQITRAATLAAVLLRDHGQTTLAAGRALPAPNGEQPWAARIELEVLAANGFGVSAQQMQTLLSDFSDGPAACPPTLRTAILEATR